MKELSERTDEYLSWVKKAGRNLLLVALPEKPAASLTRTYSRVMFLRRWQMLAGALANQVKRKILA